jgi:hypothetical protein
MHAAVINADFIEFSLLDGNSRPGGRTVWSPSEVNTAGGRKGYTKKQQAE